MKQKQHGFSAVEVLLVLLLVSFLSFVGYYVWNQQKNKDTKESTTTATTQATVPELSEQDKATQSWLLVKSGLGGFSVRIPDGWGLTNAMQDNHLFGQSLEYVAGKQAKIETIDGAYGGDGQFRLSMAQYSTTQVETPSGSGTDFETLAGDKGMKYHVTSPVEPCDGIGCSPGSDHYNYYFIKNNKVTLVSYTVFNYNQYSKDVFGIKASDKNQEQLVDTMVKTLTIN